MIKLLIISLLALIFASCNYYPMDDFELKSAKYSISEKMSLHEYKVTKLSMNAFIKKVILTRDLKIFWEAGASSGELDKCEIHFLSNKKYGIEECRKLIVDLAVEFVEQINNDSDLRPYLKEYPLLVDKFNLAVSFGVHEKNRSEDCIAMVTLIHGLITYSKNVEGNLIFNRVHRETIQDAIKILQEQNMAPNFDPLTVPAEINKKEFKKINFVLKSKSPNIEVYKMQE